MSYTEITTPGGAVRWINVINPSKEDNAYITTHFTFEKRDIDDAFQKTQRSQIVKRHDYVFFVLMIPVYQTRNRSVSIQEVDVFIQDNVLVTLHRGLKPLEQLAKECQDGNPEHVTWLKEGEEFLLYQMLYEILEYTYPIIDHMNEELEKMKRLIFAGENTRETVKEILLVRRNITDLRRALRGHAGIITHLFKRPEATLNIQFQKYRERYEELVDYANEMWDALESDKEMIEALEDANNALISHAINDVMKTLTAVSVILLPAGVLAGIFGMNVEHMPFIGHPKDFWIVAYIILSVCAVISLIFWRKHWLR